MKSIFETLTKFEGTDVGFEQLLMDLNLEKVFNDLYAVYISPAKARKAILYIVYAYSRDSYLVTTGSSWEECKERAARKVELDKEMFNELVRFEFKYEEKPKKTKTKATNKDEVDEIEEDGTGELQVQPYNVVKIINCINSYLDVQNDKINKHLRRMYDLYEQFSRAAIEMGKDGKIDWNQKATCQKEANRLFDEIETTETKLSQKNADLKDARKEVDEVKSKAVRTLRPELNG